MHARRIGGQFCPIWKGAKMKKLVLALTVVAVASPAFAQIWPNPSFQQYQHDESVRRSLEMANDAIRQQQETVNRGLNLINPPSPFCLSWQRAQGVC
jgi:hypothetical protein